MKFFKWLGKSREIEDKKVERTDDGIRRYVMRRGRSEVSVGHDGTVSAFGGVMEISELTPSPTTFYPPIEKKE